MCHETENEDGERTRDLFCKKKRFSSLLRGTVAKWYADIISDGHDWQHIRSHFLARFSDNRDKYRYRITALTGVRGNEEVKKISSPEYNEPSIGDDQMMKTKITQPEQHQTIGSNKSISNLPPEE